MRAACCLPLLGDKTFVSRSCRHSCTCTRTQRPLTEESSSLALQGAPCNKKCSPGSTQSGKISSAREQFFFWLNSAEAPPFSTTMLLTQAAACCKTCWRSQICHNLRPQVVFVPSICPELEECCVVATERSQLLLLFKAHFLLPGSELHAAVRHRRSARNRSVLWPSADTYV